MDWIKKHFVKVFWIGYVILLILTVLLSSCNTYKAYPRFKDECRYYTRLEQNGYVEVTVFNLFTGEHQVRIIKAEER